jgi:hypothetical protein
MPSSRGMSPQIGLETMKKLLKRLVAFPKVGCLINKHDKM